MITMDKESDKIIKSLSSGVTMSRGMLQDLISWGMRWKPSGYDQNIAKRRRYYDGNQLADLQNKLKRDFPRTYAKMDGVSVNYVRLYADQSSASYKEPPDRAIVSDDGEKIDASDRRAQGFSKMVKNSNLGRIMLEVERIAMVAKTVFMRVGVNQGSLIEGAPVVDVVPYWPSEVLLIPHPSAPNDLSLAIALLARITGPEGASGKGQWFEVWTRPIEGEISPGGPPTSFGPWSVEHISLLTGESRTPFGSGDAEYPLSTLPWVVMQDGYPQGTPFLDVNRDLTELQDSINSTWTDMLYTCRMQCHSELVYSGNSLEADFVGGPGAILQVGANETLSTLSYSVNDLQLDAVRRLTEQSALVNRISPDSFSADQSSVQSGISRVIQNIPQTEARLERQTIYKRMEEKHLLPIMAGISDAWIGTGIYDDSRFSVTYQEPAVYEDPQNKQARAIVAADAGYISRARAAFESGWYDSVDDAIAAGLSDDIESGDALSIFGATPEEEATVTRDLTRERIEAATAAIAVGGSE